MTLKAFVPAAGLGKRLAPLTDVLPKPLLPVLGHPILAQAVDRILDLPVEKIGVNLHHLPDMLRGFLENSPYADLIEYFPEETLLGTGGALWNARHFLSGSTFVVYNGDVRCDLDLEPLVERHATQGNLVTFAVCDAERFNTVGLDGLGGLLRVGREGPGPKPDRWVTFTGIAVYESDFLKYLPAGISHLTNAWLSALADQQRVAAYDIGPTRWSDLGSLDAYAAALMEELTRRNQERFIGRDVYVPVDCELKGRVILESGGEVGIGVRIEDSVVLPATHVKSGEKLKLKLACGTARLPLKFPKAAASPENEIQMGGSNRYYQRVTLAEGLSAVKLKSPLGDPDFDRLVGYSEAFRANGLPVPKILALDARRREIFFQDLGELDLYRWFHAGPPEGEVLPLYRRILDVLVDFQFQNIGGNELLSTFFFDKATFVWESGYFLNRFVRAYLNVEPPEETRLLYELEQLAETVNSFPKWVVHRDFQSQNIMLDRGEVHLIDYQGARMGPPGYDAVSLIDDPYIALTEGQSRTLKLYYTEAVSLRTGQTTEEVDKTLLYCGLQRHMQALGAYGYLSRIKGKKHFESHMPRGLELLRRECEQASTEFPRLHALVKSLSL